jgi:hypothetical protein
MTQQNACNALLEALPTQRQIVAELCRREQRPEQVVRQQERPRPGQRHLEFKARAIVDTQIDLPT